MVAVCGSGAGADGLESTGVDVVTLEFVSGAEGDVEPADGDAVATDGEPTVPAGWSALACATTTSAKTIVATTKPSVVR